jgi:hypothetical protein
MLKVKLTIYARLDLTEIGQLRDPCRVYWNKIKANTTTNISSWTSSAIGDKTDIEQNRYKRYLALENEYRHEQDMLVSLPNAWNNRLGYRLDKANVLLSKSVAVCIHSQKEKLNHRYDIVLSNGLILSYTTDPKNGNDLLKCSIDDSIAQLIKRSTITAAMFKDQLLVIGLENPSRLLLLINTDPNKVRLCSKFDKLFHIMNFRMVSHL